MHRWREQCQAQAHVRIARARCVVDACSVDERAKRAGEVDHLQGGDGQQRQHGGTRKCALGKEQGHEEPYDHKQLKPNLRWLAYVHTEKQQLVSRYLPPLVVEKAAARHRARVECAQQLAVWVTGALRVAGEIVGGGAAVGAGAWKAVAACGWGLLL